MTMMDLAGKRALVVGIANRDSIAHGCAAAFRAAGAELAITYVNAKAEQHVRPLAEELGASLIQPCDVREPGQLESVFDLIRQQWGGLDILLHSIAFAPREDLYGRVIDCSRDGFLVAMDVSVHSFIRMARMAEPLMPDGGCLLTVSFFGAERVVPHYNLMGPVKAALESTVRSLAVELGGGGIRVHALSPGPLKTRAASGIDRFDELLEQTAERTPIRQRVTVQDVGAYATFLASDAASAVTGSVPFIDAGYNIVS
jgi:enoyl-[acyl-carrier protein] reductase I